MYLITDDCFAQIFFMLEPGLPALLRTPSPTVYDSSQVIQRSLHETDRIEDAEAAMRQVRHVSSSLYSHALISRFQFSLWVISNIGTVIAGLGTYLVTVLEDYPEMSKLYTMEWHAIEDGVKTGSLFDSFSTSFESIGVADEAALKQKYDETADTLKAHISSTKESISPKTYCKQPQLLILRDSLLRQSAMRASKNRERDAPPIVAQILMGWLHYNITSVRLLQTLEGRQMLSDLIKLFAPFTKTRMVLSSTNNQYKLVAKPYWVWWDHACRDSQMVSVRDFKPRKRAVDKSVIRSVAYTAQHEVDLAKHMKQLLTTMTSSPLMRATQGVKGAVDHHTWKAFLHFARVCGSITFRSIGYLLLTHIADCEGELGEAGDTGVCIRELRTPMDLARHIRPSR